VSARAKEKDLFHSFVYMGCWLIHNRWCTYAWTPVFLLRSPRPMTVRPTGSLT